MSYTALSEQLGGSEDVTINSPGIYRARLPYGPNGCRLYVIRPTVAGVIFRMPDPTLMTNGAAPLLVVINKGPEALQLTNFGGINIGAALTANKAVELWLPIVGVDTWLPIGPSTAYEGNALVGTRKPIELVYSASSITGTNFRTDAAKQFGYIGADGPVALLVTVKTGVVLGQPSTWSAAVTTGSWPGGSTCLLTVESGAYLQGYGGTGGAGMTVAGTGMTAGSAGGTALECLLPTTVVNNGYIRGGGGGGGGGARRTNNSVLYVGGSGGGGAGAPGGAGGPTVGSVANSAGSAGGLEAGGLGANPGIQHAEGGAGGAPATAGTAGQAGSGGTGNGAAGGAAGYAIRRPTAITVTQLGSGTYLGGVLAF